MEKRCNPRTLEPTSLMKEEDLLYVTRLSISDDRFSEGTIWRKEKDGYYPVSNMHTFMAMNFHGLKNENGRWVIILEK